MKTLVDGLTVYMHDEVSHLLNHAAKCEYIALLCERDRGSAPWEVVEWRKRAEKALDRAIDLEAAAYASEIIRLRNAAAIAAAWSSVTSTHSECAQCRGMGECPDTGVFCARCDGSGQTSAAK